MLELKELFHRCPNMKFIVHENGFTRERIAYNGKELAKRVDGRILENRAREGIATYKHALRYAKEYMNGQEETPSGTKIEDLAVYVLKKMFVHLKGSIKTNLTKDNCDKTEDDMPSNWFFTGHFAFLLFGPVPLSGKTLSVLSEKFENVEKQSRKED